MDVSIVYRERHHLIAHLAAIYPSIMMLNADPDEPDWPVIFIEMPTGQVSWHIAPDDMGDGHDVAEKYDRLDEHTKALAAQ